MFPLQRQGTLMGVVAYVIWGLSAIYWRLLVQVPAMQLLCHRIVWALPVAAVVAVATGHGPTTRSCVSFQATTVVFYIVTATLLGINLCVSIVAANAGFIVELSLGYFTSPLVTVLLGVVMLRERLRRWQWVAIAMATSGLLTVTFLYGKFPWISIVLAANFGVYGLMQKKAPLVSVQGICIEFAILTVPSAVYLIYEHRRGTAAFMSLYPGYDILLVGLGVLTVTPQLLFSTAIKRIPLTTMGLLQFIGPTLNILTGVVIYNEDFQWTKAIGFAQVWLGLVIYAIDLVRYGAKPASAPTDAVAATDRPTIARAADVDEALELTESDAASTAKPTAKM
ncbi:protein RarD [Aphanomyces invadans]|uniref:Protein RarD n=1 Tax=Aphanomyces invadans TaxID=157072 RepID=A0A024TVU5_9STRA|nr:protein RarD [Aphanomyces invadans]ETV98114.1 protein RarD [Aphanomyces invadans]|eukprot:XP_008872989.1 protein RarD [Aphanomyces invadans]